MIGEESELEQELAAALTQALRERDEPADELLLINALRQIAAIAALTEAEHRADEWSDEWSRTQANLNEMRHRAERYREALQAIALNPGWSNLSDIARAALDTTAGPGGMR